MKAFTLIPLAVLSVNAVVTRIIDWPDFKSLPICAKDPLDMGVFNVLKCGITPLCVCDRYSDALSIVESLATKSNCPETGISSASSVLSAFCHQLPSVTFVFTDSPPSFKTSPSPVPASLTTTATSTNSPSSSFGKLGFVDFAKSQILLRRSHLSPKLQPVQLLQGQHQSLLLRLHDHPAHIIMK